MPIDLSAAGSFMAAHARVLDRRRWQFLTGDVGAQFALTALDAYANPDGGYGSGLEPDLRSAESQPGPALHAFEVFAEVAPVVTPRAAALCDWLGSVTLPDGGIPFALPLTDPAWSAPFWAGADPATSSLQISAIVAANAHRVAVHDPAVRAHPWLARITEYCFAAIDSLGGDPHALVFAFAVRFLDAAHDRYPEAAPLLAKLAALLPETGMVPVAGGSPGEALRPLDFAPLPETPARKLFAPEQIDAELERLAARQEPDGGWSVDFASYSPAATLEWRGYTTVQAFSILRANGLLG